MQLQLTSVATGLFTSVETSGQTTCCHYYCHHRQILLKYFTWYSNVHILAQTTGNQRILTWPRLTSASKGQTVVTRGCTEANSTASNTRRVYPDFYFEASHLSRYDWLPRVWHLWTVSEQWNPLPVHLTQRLLGVSLPTLRGRNQPLHV